MIFVLGIERSATTWVANILDHHPATEVFMEPLSSFTSGFKKWPDRFTNLEEFESIASYFKEELKLVSKNKHLFYTRFSDSKQAWAIDLYLSDILVRKKLASNKIRDFLELNFHRKGQDFFVTKQPPLQTVIKELRLNFNAGLIGAIDVEAKILISIREAASCIRSILSQLEQGNLVELKKLLRQKYGSISPQTICRYWFESYSCLLKDVQKYDMEFEVVSHTELLESPRKTVEEFLQFLGLNITPSVINFLEYSDQAGAGKHSTKRSRDELIEQMQKDREMIYPNIGHELTAIKSHPILKNFVQSV